MLKPKFQLTKNKILAIFSFTLFIVTRIIILVFYPQNYSDVKHDYERYANMWWYGLPPYLKHLYEYPPATIPLLILPLVIDLWGIGFYYLNYRIQIFLFELILFFFFYKIFTKFFLSGKKLLIAVIFYCIAVLIAKDFWYEGIDLIFIGTLVLAFFSFLLTKAKTFKSNVLFWGLFWLSVAIKLITLPLLVPLFLIKNKCFSNELKAVLAGFLLIWGVPLLIFRTSLSVFLLFHTNRPLHASSFPAFIVYTLNHFTKSEEIINLEWFGPLSQKVLSYSFISTIGVTILFLLISTFLILRIRQKKLTTKNKYFLMIKYTLIYLLLFIFTSKIFSPPFNIWYAVLLTVFLYKNIKSQLIFYFLAILSLVLNTTNIVKLPETTMIYPFVWSYLRNLFRFPPLFILLYMTIKSREKI